MTLNLSRFGKRFARSTGTLELMDDLGRAMSGEADVIMLGGGNPGHVPGVHELFRRRVREVASSAAEFDRMLARYAHPQGESTFRSALARLLSREHGFDVTADNIALTGGSQSSFFLLFNMLAGLFEDGSRRRIVLPVTPEYVGYADLGLDEDLFVSRRPAIERLDGPYFKYRIDFDRLELDDTVGAVCVSRPTNPTGNVLTDAEMRELERRCREQGVPLIVDNAYGLPFPNAVFTQAELRFDDGIVLCMSLSKLGLPGVRTGIVVASPEIVEALTRMTAIMSLAVGSVGPVLTAPLIEDGSLVALARDEIRPFYRDKAARACKELERGLEGLPYRIHKPEGAFFLWLWLENLPITSAELYARLKRRGVIVMSGHHFFPGLADAWRHRDECLRISYAQDDERVADGIAVIADEARRAYETPA